MTLLRSIFSGFVFVAGAALVAGVAVIIVTLRYRPQNAANISSSSTGISGAHSSWRCWSFL